MQSLPSSFTLDGIDRCLAPPLSVGGSLTWTRSARRRRRPARPQAHDTTELPPIVEPLPPLDRGAGLVMLGAVCMGGGAWWGVIALIRLTLDGL